MADLPHGVTASDDGRRAFVRHVLPRWIAATIIGALLLLALFNVFGQAPEADRAEDDVAMLEVYAPTKVRGGLFYQGRFTVEAKREIRSATLVLDRGWLESMHINTIEPSPVGESSRDGRLALDFGHVPRGVKLVAYLQFQVNPTNVGRRSQDVRLADGEDVLLTVDRDVTIYP